MPGDPAPDFTVKPVLAGEKVILRPFREEDIPAMALALADPEVRRLAPRQLARDGERQALRRHCRIPYIRTRAEMAVRTDQYWP